jgi:hypothetical protein
VVLLLERGLVSWSQAMDERDAHEDLCGSGHQSVIHYVHRRTELYYSSLLCLSLPFLSPPFEEAPTRVFYSSRSGSYIETQGPTGGPMVVETLYNI